MGSEMSFTDILENLEFGASRAKGANRAKPPVFTGHEADAKPGLSGANHLSHDEKLARLARPGLSPEPAGMAAISPISPISPTPEENKKLSDDFRFVSTWWQWSPDDISNFKEWARLNRELASEWIHQEAGVCRHRRDHLHVASVNEFISPAIPANTCTSTK